MQSIERRKKIIVWLSSQFNSKNTLVAVTNTIYLLDYLLLANLIHPKHFCFHSIDRLTIVFVEPIYQILRNKYEKSRINDFMLQLFYILPHKCRIQDTHALNK